MSTGTIFVADTANHRLRAIAPSGQVRTLSGSGYAAMIDSSALTSAFYNPWRLAVDPTSTLLLVTDQLSYRVRSVVISTGEVSTLAGSGASAWADSAVATSASFVSPRGLAFDTSAPPGVLRVYVADGAGHRVRVLTCTSPSPSPSPSPGASPSFTPSTSAPVAPSPTRSPTSSGTPQGCFVFSLAGSAAASAVNGIGSSAGFNGPTGVVADAGGTLLVADRANHRIRVVTTGGVVTTLAGSSAGYADGQGSTASFNAPTGIALDDFGLLYVTDTSNQRIRVVSPVGSVITLAGSGAAGLLDAIGTAAQFSSPTGIAVDTATSTVYVSDSGSSRIRVISPTDTAVSTLAGSGAAAFLDGLGTNAAFNSPNGLSLLNGNLLVADTANARVRSIVLATRRVTTLAGSGTVATVDGVGSSASLNSPWGIASSPTGMAYVAESAGNRVRALVTATGALTTVVGTGLSTPFVDGVAAPMATLSGPQGLAVDPANPSSLWVVDTGNHRLRLLTCASPSASPTPTPTPSPGASLSATPPRTPSASPSPSPSPPPTPAYLGCLLGPLAGSIIGSAGATDALGSNALFYTPFALSLDASGRSVVADRANNRIRLVTLGGSVSTLVGSSAGSADSIATSATFNAPYGVETDFASGAVFVADYSNCRIRRASASAVVTTLAGGGLCTFVDSMGTSAQFQYPAALCKDASPSLSKLFVADVVGHRIRIVSASGLTSTLAGSGTPAFADGTGTGASFNAPRGLTMTPGSATLFVSDSGNNRIRAISLTSGAVTTLAGSGFAAWMDGTGLGASFRAPLHLCMGPSGTLLVADSGSHVIRSVTQAGVVTTIAGTGVAGAALAFSTPALAAALSSPSAVTYSASTGAIRIADMGNNALRVLVCPSVSPTATPTPTASAGTSASASAAPTPSATPSATPSMGGCLLTAFIGSGSATFADGLAGSAAVNQPSGLALDPTTAFLVVADRSNQRIRRVSPSGMVSTLAGSGSATFAEGTGAGASFFFPEGLVVDGAGQVYVVDYQNHRIRKVSPAGFVATFAGSGSAQWADGAGQRASFNLPFGITLDPSPGGSFYVTDSSNFRVRVISPAGQVTTLAGSGASGSLDSVGLGASFTSLTGIALTPDGGTVLVGDAHRIRAISVGDGSTFTVAGGGTPAFANGLGTAAAFSTVNHLAFDAPGSRLLVVDGGNHRVRAVAWGGSAGAQWGGGSPVTTVVGSGSVGSTLALAQLAALSSPRGVAVDNTGLLPSLAGALYISDSGNAFVRRLACPSLSPTPTPSLSPSVGASASATATPCATLTPTPTPSASGCFITTLAGSGSATWVDAPGLASSFNTPTGVAADAAGVTIFVADSNGHRLRRVSIAGAAGAPGAALVSTLAGSGGATFADGIGASASFSYPAGVALDPAGNLLVADRNNNRVRKVSPTGVVFTLAGSGGATWADGNGIAASFYCA